MTGCGATHAWAVIFVPGAGCVQFGPAHRIIASRNLICVAASYTPLQSLPVVSLKPGTVNGLLTTETVLLVRSSIDVFLHTAAAGGSRPFENGARGSCTSQDVLDFAGASLPAALGSFALAVGFAVSTSFGFIAATAQAVMSLKDMSSIL
ncbi:hypothetical protein [Defluviimonas salinarum]|uniref:Uncharacterized protein n=1 Tax=Defluviimonas salinarum TaxID=2992147 RepID=A0ABT3JAA9_9RHOB|nr:hypothetical protein [Defluviimonas salinarum]MCW3784639.1 hypothetical protein [Defluviimonas salinarum]